jgi:hypothetical protein
VNLYLCLGHVYHFGVHGATAPWVFGVIAFGVATIVAVHVYRSVRKRRARARRRADRNLVDSAAQPFPVGTLVDRCTRETCGVFDELSPPDCPTRIRLQCFQGCPELHQGASETPNRKDCAHSEHCGRLFPTIEECEPHCPDYTPSRGGSV